jgi:zinc transporter 5/7
MHGIFLHIAADAGGSLAVILSTALALWRPWYLWDPLATIFIAVLIFAAAVPLVTSSARKLLLVLPEAGNVEWSVREALREVVEIRGVVGVAAEGGLRVWEGVAADAEDEGKKEKCGHAHHDHDHHHHHDHGHHDHKHDHHHDHAHSHSHDHTHLSPPPANTTPSPHDHHHPHDHAHHDHSHPAPPITLVGAIHIIAHPSADLEDVRSRVVEFLRARGMDLVVQVERDAGVGVGSGGAGSGSPPMRVA